MFSLKEIIKDTEGIINSYPNDRIPSKWEEAFGDLNQLGPCLTNILIGYKGKMYNCYLRVETPPPYQFDLTYVDITVQVDGLEETLAGSRMTTIADWSDVRGQVLRGIMNAIIQDHLREHKECYYK